MKGRLGAWELYAGINQAVYVNNYTDAAVISVSICNRNHLPTYISIANTTSDTSPTNAEWIEYDVELLGKGVLERTGIIISPNHFLVVQSNIANVNAVVWGTQLGTLIPIPLVLSQNTGVAPSWVTSATLPDITSDGYIEINISAT
jgi:hypothetical protein